MLRTPKAHNNYREYKVNEVYNQFQCVLSATSVGTGRLGRTNILELLCMRCEAFMGVLR